MLPSSSAAPPTPSPRERVALAPRPPSALFLAHSETPRRELDGWAEQLLRALAGRRAWPARSDAHVARVIGSTNAAALLEAHRGDLDGAERICRAQLRWLASHPGRRRLAIARHAVNPWINLGRLAGMRGDVPGALEHFAAFAPAGNRFLAIGPLRIRRRALNELLQNEHAFRDFAAHVYVVDALRALVRQRDSAALSRFLDTPAARLAVRRAGGAVETMVAEARLVARMHDGDASGGGEEARRLASRTAGVVRAVFTIRAAECDLHASAGARRGPSAALTDALTALEALVDRDPPSLLAIALDVHAARLSAASARPGVARRLARVALERATTRGDVLLQHASLELLASLPGRDRLAASRTLGALVGGTAYRSVSGRTAPRPPSLTALLAETATALDDPALAEPEAATPAAGDPVAGAIAWAPATGAAGGG